VEMEPLRKMVWRGGLPFGLFTGLRTFLVEPRDNGQARFTMTVEFRGPLAGPIARSLGDRQPDIEALAAGLQAWAEGA